MADLDSEEIRWRAEKAQEREKKKAEKKVSDNCISPVSATTDSL